MSQYTLTEVMAMVDDLEEMESSFAKEQGISTTVVQKSGDWYDDWSETMHTGLDLLGMIPVVGMVADAINLVMYACEGDLVNVGMSALAFIPIAGTAVAGTKLGAKAVKVGMKYADNVVKAGAKYGDNITKTIGKYSGKYGDEAMESIAKKSDDTFGNVANACGV